MALEASVWFPTLIWQDKLDIDLSPIVDGVMKLKSTSDGVKITNFGGWQSESQSSWGISKDIGEKIDSHMNEIAKQTQLPELKLNNFWYNVNTFGDYNTLHNHRGSIFSGVFYIDVPDTNMGNINFERGDDIAYYMPPLEKYNNFTGERASYGPETGKLIIFPSWLKHSVDGCRSKKNRISMSFNYGIK